MRAYGSDDDSACFYRRAARLERTISLLDCDCRENVRQAKVISPCSIDVIAFRTSLRNKKSVWRPCPSVCLYICLWTNISCLKSCWIFVKSGVAESGVSSCKSAQWRTLLEGVNDFLCPQLPCFLSDLHEIGHMFLNCCQVQGNRSIESHSLSVVVNAILLIFSTFYTWFG
jgi:hypothetical protein